MVKNKDTEIIDFRVAKETKEFIENANNKLFEFENALYEILESPDIQTAREIAANILGEDVEIYNEIDILEEEELDFEDEQKVYTYREDLYDPWEDED